LGNVKESGHVEDLGVDGRIIKYVVKKLCGMAWIGFIWLSIGTRGGVVVNMVTNLWVPYNAGDFLTN
jgi:hypothetical protein